MVPYPRPRLDLHLEVPASNRHEAIPIRGIHLAESLPTTGNPSWKKTSEPTPQQKPELKGDYPYSTPITLPPRSQSGVEISKNLIQ